MGSVLSPYSSTQAHRSNFKVATAEEQDKIDAAQAKRERRWAKRAIK